MRPKFEQNISRLPSQAGHVFVPSDSSVARNLRLSELHDPGVLYFMRKHHNHLYPLADVGANVGIFSIWAAMQKTKSQPTRVCAFEPDDQNLMLLRRNCEENQLTNVEIFPIAVASYDGMIEVGSIDCGVSSRGKESRHQVPCRTLASIEQELDIRFSFVKLDIEGGEIEAIKGLVQPGDETDRVIELEFSWRDHHRHVEDLKARFPLPNWQWEFLVTSKEAEVLQNCIQVDLGLRRPLFSVSARCEGSLDAVLQTLEASTVDRPSSKWELCLSRSGN